MKSAQPQLLIDSDAFCKLAAARLLDETLTLLGVSRPQCARLPALPHVLRKGRIRARYGEAEADRLSALAGEFQRMPDASTEWLDAVAGATDIDPGEAQIYAVAAEHRLLVLTGDKRALAAVSRLAAVYPRLDGNVVTIEAALLGMNGRMPECELRTRGKVLGNYDQMAKAVFGSASSSLHEALGSYVAHLESQMRPLKLWHPDGSESAQ